MGPTPLTRPLRLVAAVAALAFASCRGDATDGEPFGTTRAGEAVQVHRLVNANGIEMTVIGYGGIIQTLRVPDREGRLEDIVLGFDSLESYLGEHPYFGAIVGRYGNRIANGEFTLDGQRYVLAKNNGPNHLHGGLEGFDNALWDVAPFQDARGNGLVLTYTSPAGEEGYPGTLSATVTYTLTDADELIIDYLATTDAPTPVNLTQHSYFNLAGEGTGDILGHIVTIDADRYTPVDSTLIPTGEIAAVEGTPFDFRSPLPIGERIEQPGDDQLRYGGGYDHNFVLNGQRGGDTPTFAARVVEPRSGRVMEVLTTEPGMQFYSGNFLDGTLTGKRGAAYAHRHGFAMETQHFPDSPNQPGFPSTILRPGEEYRSRTVYRFSVQD